MKRLGLLLLFAAASLAAHAQSLFPYKVGDVWGYMDVKGKSVVDPQYLAAGAFVADRAYVVTTDRLAGYIDAAGGLVIEPQYQAALPFGSGLASVMKDQQWLVIDKTGKTVLPGPYAEPLEFHEGLARVRKGNRWGFVNTKSELVIPYQFATAGDFYEGRALVQNQEDYYGYIDKTGKVVIDFKYAYGFVMTMGGTPYYFESNFHDGVATVTLPAGGMLAIDPQGKVLLGKDAGIAGDYSDGLIPILTEGKYGFVDLSGKVVIEPQFLEAGDFSEGLAAVKVKEENGWGFINKKGKLVVPAQFHGPTHALFNPIKFEGGLAQVMLDEKVWAYVDKKGRVVWQKPAK